LNKFSELLNRFIGTQRCLEFFNMSGYENSDDNGLELLESLSLASCNTLQHLDITEFFVLRSSGDDGIHGVPAFRSLMARFTRLTSVKMSYHCLDEELLLRLTRNCARTLQEIALQFADDEPFPHSISSSTWREVRRLCPELGVEVNLSSYEETTDTPDIINFLPQGMPLKKLYYHSSVKDEETAAVFQQLYYFVDLLEELCLSIVSFEESSLTEVVVNLILACRNLKHLADYGGLLGRHVEAICEAQKDGRLKLKSCSFDVAGTQDDIELEDALKAIEAKYVPIFAFQNAKLSIDNWYYD